MMPRFGYRPSPPDARDFDASRRLGAGPVPPAASARQYVQGVLNQNANDCVANSGAQAIRASHVQQGAVDPPLMSRRSGYYFPRKSMGEQDVDEGTYIRLFFDCVRKIGFCPESAWPYDKDFAKQPDAEAIREAYDQKSKGGELEYARILTEGDDRALDVKRAIAAGHLVVFGTSVDDDFASNVGTQYVIKPPVDAKVTYGHAMCYVGYDGDVFDVVNSWGTGFGDGGFCKMAGDYVRWPATKDLWVVKSPPLFSDALANP